MTQEVLKQRIEEILPNNPDVESLQAIITQIMALDNESFTPTLSKTLVNVVTDIFNSEVSEQSIKQLKQNLNEQNITRSEVLQYLNNFENNIHILINDLEPTTTQRELLNAVFQPIINIFNGVMEQYHSYDITLPIKLDSGAQTPTYAHDTDACADLYAAETITIPAHSTSTMIYTGVHIALPEGWVAMIFPRSSMGAKTGLRLSNSVGIIDQDYRGQLGVLYDNVSDSDYTINAGDRIAQLMVLPSHRFKAEVVDILPATERGEGGFGSSGK